MHSNPDQYAHQNSLRADIAQLRSRANSLTNDVAEASDLMAIATACHELWMHLETIDLFVHDFVLEEHLSSDVRAADPLEAIRAHLDAAREQVRGVMAEEYEVETARKRLTMSLAVSETVLVQASGYIDTLNAPQSGRQV